MRVTAMQCVANLISKMTFEMNNMQILCICYICLCALSIILVHSLTHVTIKVRTIRSMYMTNIDSFLYISLQCIEIRQFHLYRYHIIYYILQLYDIYNCAGHLSFPVDAGSTTIMLLNTKSFNPCKKKQQGADIYIYQTSSLKFLSHLEYNYHLEQYNFSCECNQIQKNTLRLCS